MHFLGTLFPLAGSIFQLAAVSCATVMAATS